MEDPYSVLGLRAGASNSQVRRAFKKLAFQHHPDRNPDDPAAARRFKRIFAAFQALEGNHPLAGPSSRRVYKAVWSDPWHPEPPTIQPSDDEHLHYPTAEEIAALEVPSRFRPTRWLGWMVLSLLGFALVMAYAHYWTGVPVAPPDPNAKKVIESLGRY
jgi:hypothetical protein